MAEPEPLSWGPDQACFHRLSLAFHYGLELFDDFGSFDVTLHLWHPLIERFLNLAFERCHFRYKFP